jgi:uncharacterized Zn finger protein
MKQLTMYNGTVVDETDIKLDCTRCEAFRDYHRKDDDPETVVRCDDCGKRHSKHSLVDTNVAGIA